MRILPFIREPRTTNQVPPMTLPTSHDPLLWELERHGAEADHPQRRRAGGARWGAYTHELGSLSGP